MTKATLAFQPEAERYYAEGYWREGDLWSDFDARAKEHADRVALFLDDRSVTYAELRRAAIGVSNRLSEGGVQPGEVVILLGRHSIEAAVAMLGCLHRGVVLAPLPPMFNETQMSALLEQTQATAIVCFGGDKEIAKCREVAGDRLLLLPLLPEDVDAFAAQDLPADRTAASRRRPRAGPALVGDDVGAEGHRPLEQHPALRLRGRLRALGADRRGRLPDRRRVRLRRRPRLRLPPGAAQRRHRGPAQPVEARGGIAADRGAPLHLRPRDAHARGGHGPRRRARRRATSPPCACSPARD